MKNFYLFSLIFSLCYSCCPSGCTDPEAINYEEDVYKDDGSCIYPINPSIEVKSGEINADETWTADKIYELHGRVYVKSGVTLTIEPGTIVKSREGSGTNASYLLISRGAKLIAEGTPNHPIIFTTVLDNIAVGDLVGSNLDVNDSGKWGGLVICGNAPISSLNGDVESVAIPMLTGDLESRYGGDDVNDDSGILSYVSIRHAGTLVSGGYYSDGLILAGVGKGTQIDHIEINDCEARGIGLYGGSVDLSNVVVSHTNDACLLIDENYQGEVFNFLLNGDFDQTELLSVEGPKGGTYTSGMFKLKLGEVRSSQNFNKFIKFQNLAQGFVENVNFEDSIWVEASFSADCSSLDESAYTHLTQVNPTLSFTNCMHDGVGVYADCVVSNTMQQNAQNMIPNLSPQSVDFTVFENWTWIDYLGEL